MVVFLNDFQIKNLLLLDSILSNLMGEVLDQEPHAKHDL